VAAYRHSQVSFSCLVPVLETLKALREGEPARDRDGNWEPYKEIKRAEPPADAPKPPDTPPVKEIKLGMDFSQVEAALGQPETRVDLGQKVLYKYKDMTVEFRDGKVADVR
jgi:hypothetical protein